MSYEPVEKDSCGTSSLQLTERSHFPGTWGRRELKESPIQCAKQLISPIKLIFQDNCKTANKNSVRNDSFALFYCYHFSYAEELFYGHMALMVIMAQGNGEFLTKMLRANRDRTLEITQFQFLKKLGTGTFGTVFLANHPTRNQLVAVKKMLIEDLTVGMTSVLRTLIEKEASCHSQGSPHIIELLDAFTVSSGLKKAYYLVYEYADGGTLNHFIMKLHGYRVDTDNLDWFFTNRFPGKFLSNNFIAAFTKYLGAQLFLGVRALHERGIIHLDLKPENILLTKNGIVKIADLGMVKRYRWFHYSARAEFLIDVHTETPNTLHGDFTYIGGSLLFLEPELRGKFLPRRSKVFQFINFDYEITFNADYFALGMILFQLFTGFIYGIFFEPFGGHIKAAIMNEKLNDLALLAWYAFRDRLDKTSKEILDLYSPDNLMNITEGLDEGLMNLVKSTMQPRTTRWKEYTDSIKISRDGEIFDDNIVNLSKIRRKIFLFKDIDFEGIAINGLPEFLVEFLHKKPPTRRRSEHMKDEDLNEPLADETHVYPWPFFEYHKPKDEFHAEGMQIRKEKYGKERMAN